MNEAGLALMAIEPLPRGDWLAQTESVLIAANYSVKKRRTALLVWREQKRFANLIFSNASIVRRIWLAPRRWALGVVSKRLYFKKLGSEIDRRPEHILLKESRLPEHPTASKVVEQQWRLIQILQKGLRPHTTPVMLQPLGLDLKKARVVKIGTKSFYSPPESLNTLYCKYGIDQTPNQFTVSVCPLESVSDHVANKFSVRLRHVAEQRNTALKVQITSAVSIIQRLKEIRSSGNAPRDGSCVLFILPSKKQNLHNETQVLFEKLRDVHVPFRRAYADDPIQYSIPDQFPSLVIASGGHPHKSPTKVADKLIWTIGIDLSHRPERSFSVIVLTLVNPEGRLVGAWIKTQPRDETARVKSLKTLLVHCRQELSTCEPKAKVVVLRDGRMFENENGDLYGEMLETDVSLLEFRKYGNPQIFRLDDRQALPSEPIAAVLSGTSTMFMTTAPPKNENLLASVAKVTWDREWNGLGLEASEIGSILAASAASPGLGLHSRNLPAAIYWADGIAGTCSEDLRFIGVPVVNVESSLND